MELRKLLKGVENYKIKGDEELNIKKIESNSKKIIENSLFIAIKGFDVDGHDYVEEAIENGAVAVVLDMNANLKKIKISKDITVVIVDDRLDLETQITSTFNASDIPNLTSAATKEELLKALKAEKSQEKEIEKYINAVDKNGDGKIDYKEFLELMGAEK